MYGPIASGVNVMNCEDDGGNKVLPLSESLNMTDKDKWTQGNNNQGNTARRVPFTIIDAKTHFFVEKKSSYQQRRFLTMTKTTIRDRKMVCASLCNSQKRYVFSNYWSENDKIIIMSLEIFLSDF